jgi:hypothetical protein
MGLALLFGLSSQRTCQSRLVYIPYASLFSPRSGGGERYYVFSLLLRRRRTLEQRGLAPSNEELAKVCASFLEAPARPNLVQASDYGAK